MCFISVLKMLDFIGSTLEHSELLYKQGITALGRSPWHSINDGLRKMKERPISRLSEQFRWKYRWLWNKMAAQSVERRVDRTWGFPGGSCSKESACKVWDLGSIPVWGDPNLMVELKGAQLHVRWESWLYWLWFPEKKGNFQLLQNTDIFYIWYANSLSSYYAYVCSHNIIHSIPILKYR